MTDEQKAELKALEQKLAARKGRPGWADSSKAIEARIAEIKNDAN